jgi:meiotically up-regulated gene 157 (Mug157) protein
MADFYALTGDEAVLNRFQGYLPGILNSISERRSEHTYLFATDETPADDPLRFSYHFSSLVLLWYTFKRLAELPQLNAVMENGFDHLAKKIYRDIWRHFTVKEENVQLFAYATDLSGHYSLYHDANDYPTVLAPLWGFCSRDDRTWQATMEFALSKENRDGYFPGLFGGLGSQHTPGAWSLGDVQELIYANIRGDSERAGRTINRLARTACLDGSLPEARDPLTGKVVSRHWFAWPGSALLYALNLFGAPGKGTQPSYN